MSTCVGGGRPATPFVLSLCSLVVIVVDCRRISGCGLARAAASERGGRLLDALRVSMCCRNASAPRATAGVRCCVPPLVWAAASRGSASVCVGVSLFLKGSRTDTARRRVEDVLPLTLSACATSSSAKFAPAEWKSACDTSRALPKHSASAATIAVGPSPQFLSASRSSSNSSQLFSSSSSAVPSVSSFCIRSVDLSASSCWCPLPLLSPRPPPIGVDSVPCSVSTAVGGRSEKAESRDASSISASSASKRAASSSAQLTVGRRGL